jgi:predicted small metal-binding protein
MKRDCKIGEKHRLTLIGEDKINKITEKNVT